MSEVTILKVAAASSPTSVAGAIAGILRKGERMLEIRAVGAGSVNQAVKSIAIARGYVAPNGYDLVCIPAFMDGTINDERGTVMKLIVKVV
ncbi:MAG: stage V sporulation protein S [Bacteroidota bacterium]|nr:stage V sporulation protein S [Bacteroidota bacterium]